MKNRFPFLSALPATLFGFALAAGCASQPSAESLVRNRMKSNPEEFRRAEILPIWVNGIGVTDTSLSTNDLGDLTRQAGSNMVAALCEVLRQRGYSIVQSGIAICGEEDTRKFDDETQQILTQVRTNCAELSLEISANRPYRTGAAPEFLLDPCISDLRQHLASPDADVLVLLETNLRFESKTAHDKRVKTNETVGAALMPLYIASMAAAMAGPGGGGPLQFPLESTPSWIHYNVLIADARTREVLYWNDRAFPHENPRNVDALRDKLRDTLDGFAQLPRPKPQPTN